MQAIRYFKATGVRKFLFIDPEKLQTYYRVMFHYKVGENMWQARIVDRIGAEINYNERFEKLSEIVNDVMSHLWVLTYSG